MKDSYNQVFGDLQNPEVKRLVEKQSVEMSYWRLQGIPFKIVFGDRDINKTLAMNISLVVEYYDLSEDRKSTRLNSSHLGKSRMPSSA